MELSLWLSVLPSLTAIVTAMFTRQVIPSLLAGLWLGAFLRGPALMGSIARTIDYIIGMLSDPDNLNVLLFLYVFSGLVSMIQIAGGVSGFAQAMSAWVKSRRGTLVAAWLLEPLTFIDCGFRVVATGAVIKPLAQRHGISGERLAYTLNNSASPLISLIPIATTYVGYMLGVISSGMQVADVAGSPFITFLKTIPFNFFSMTSLLVAFGSIFSPWQFSAMKRADEAARGLKAPSARTGETTPDFFQRSPALQFESANELTPGQLGGARTQMDTAQDQMGVVTGKHVGPGRPRPKHGKKGQGPASMEHDHDMEVESILPPRAFNLYVPIGLLILLSFLVIWWDGSRKGNTLLEIFSRADASRDMFLALFITTVMTVFLYLFQRISLKDLTDKFIQGGNKLMVTIVILAVAWPIATVSKDLGLPRLITATIGNTLPGPWVPLVAFLVTAIVTYFIGSSWGAWALMMPLAIPLAAVSGAPIHIWLRPLCSRGAPSATLRPPYLGWRPCHQACPKWSTWTTFGR